MSDWFEEAKKLYKPGVYGYRKIARDFGKSIKTVESRFLRAKKNGELEQTLEQINEDKPLKELILNDIQKPCEIDYLLQKYKISKRILNATIEDIEESGYDVEMFDNKLLIKKHAEEENKTFNINLKEGWHRIGVVSDTHLNSKYQQLTYLKDTYDIFQRESVEMVLHTGDICAGMGMYKGQEYEVFNHGADEQAEYAIKNYPKRDFITYLISGNHDLSFYKKSGVDICKKIAEQRHDIKYLGQFGAYLEIAKGIKIYLLHPDSGIAYAVSYKPQKIISGFMGGDKPNILLIGHYHQSEYLFERNIHTLQCSCFESQTPYLRRKGIMPKIGGWLIEFKIENDSVTRFKQEYITYFEHIEGDY